MDRKALVIKLAPAAPPCFPDRLTWLEFVQQALEASRGVALMGPLDLRYGEPRFNHALDFCADCTAKHAWQMQKEGKCVPDHLMSLAPKEKASA